MVHIYLIRFLCVCFNYPYVCQSYIFGTTDIFVTKVDMVMYFY